MFLYIIIKRLCFRSHDNILAFPYYGQMNSVQRPFVPRGLFTFSWSFSRACPPRPPINNVENILFDKPWPQNRFNNSAQGGWEGKNHCYRRERANKLLVLTIFACDCRQRNWTISCHRIRSIFNKHYPYLITFLAYNIYLYSKCDITLLGTIHYLWPGVGWQKSGWVMRYFWPKKGGGGYLKILPQKEGSNYFIIVGGNLTCNDYCYCRERARQHI